MATVTAARVARSCAEEGRHERLDDQPRVQHLRLLDCSEVVVLRRLRTIQPHWIPAFWVPALLVTHYVTFVLLAKPSQPPAAVKGRLRYQDNRKAAKFISAVPVETGRSGANLMSFIDDFTDNFTD